MMDYPPCKQLSLKIVKTIAWIDSPNGGAFSGDSRFGRCSRYLMALSVFWGEDNLGVYPGDFSPEIPHDDRPEMRLRATPVRSSGA
jgi:hypothetical protein